MDDATATYALRTSQFAVEAIVLLVERMANRRDIDEDTIIHIRALANNIGIPYAPAEHQDWARAAIGRLSAAQRGLNGEV